MANSNTVSDTGQKVLQEVLDHLNNLDDPLEAHLPQEIFRLDKPALLAVIYRLLAYIPDKEKQQEK